MLKDDSKKIKIFSLERLRRTMLLKKKEKTSNIKVNAIFNAIYQVLILIVPLITTPYISTIFASDVIGSYSYGFSLVQYFVLAANFGFTIYGTTIIAKYRNDKVEENKKFWGLMYCKTILDVVVIGIFFGILYSGILYNGAFPLNDNNIYLIFSLNIFASLFDTTFLFQGKEKFVNLCIRNLIVKVVSTILIFIFVKVEADYRIYVLILSCSYFFSGFITLINTPFMVSKPVKVSFKELGEHFKQSFIFFLPSLATTIYTIASKSILGAIQGDSFQSGYYEQANKIIDIIVSLVNSINTILMARMAYLYATHQEEEIKRKTDKTMQLYSVIAPPCFFGLIVINDYLTLGFLGPNYEGSVILIYILAIKILIVPISNIIGSIYYIPCNLYWKRTIYLCSGAIFNILINTLLVYFFSSIGASIGIVLTEILVSFLYVWGSRKDIDYSAFFKDIWRTLIASLVMFGVTFGLKFIMHDGIGYLLPLMNIDSERIIYFVTAVILVVIGVVVYGVLLLILKEPLTTGIVLGLKNKFISIIKKNKSSEAEKGSIDEENKGS